MDRRTLLAGLATVTASRPAWAQARTKLPIVGFVGFATAAVDLQMINPFRQALAALGYEEGRNILVEVRHSDNDVKRGYEMIDELIALPVSLFLSPGPAATRALARRTKIPVVAIALPAERSEPELFESFARPGGSVTGFSVFGEEMSAKRIEMIREVIPNLKTVGVLHNAIDPAFQAWGDQTLADIRKQGLEAVRLGLDSASPTVVANYIRGLRDRGGNAAVIATRDFLTSALMADICKAGLAERVAVVGEHTAFTRAGALFSYGVDIRDLFRRAAEYVDRIIKGEKAGELPIQLPTKFDLSLNLKTARALGIEIPPSIVIRAENVIE